jgi:Tetratricopeptide repeat
MKLALQMLLVISILFISQAAEEDKTEQWMDEAYDYYSSNRYDDAIDAFDNALALDEDNKEAWAGKGDAYYNLGDYANAVESYNRYFELDKTNAEILYRKGLALKGMGNDEEAKNAWNAAIIIDSSYAFRVPDSDERVKLVLSQFNNSITSSQNQITWDFEHGDLRGWTKTGDAFDYQPTFGDNIAVRNQGHAGQQGDYWVSTYEKYSGPDSNLTPGDIQGYDPIGKLVSLPFEITGDKINFLIGGGSQCSVNLVINGSIKLSSNGGNKDTLSRVEWNMSPYKRETAFIELTDNSSSTWGYISFDDVIFDSPPIVIENQTVIPLEISDKVISPLVINPL